MTNKDLTFFSSIRKPNETLIETKKRFFRELTEVDPDYEGCHKVIRAMFKEFKRICDENKINYFLMGGSCIGAIRSGDLIPWDLDGDVGMLRIDFQKLVNAIKSSKFIEIRQREKFTEDGDSYIVPKIFVKNGSNRIVIDIIVWDRVRIPDGMDSYNFWKLRNSFRNLYQANESMTRLQGLLKGTEEFLRKFEDPNGDYLIQGMESYISTKAVTFEKIMPISMVFPLTILDFCGDKYSACNDYMSYIELEWGDIWSIPEFETFKGAIKLELKRSVRVDQEVLKELIDE